MEYIKINGLDLKAGRIALGTWAIGGWLWGGQEEQNSIDTILKAIDLGINVIDTAPVYGFGVSEEVCGKAIKLSGKRDKLLIATKCGLDWYNGKVFRNSQKQRILKEIDDSLRRLDCDYIDIYQLHWHDKNVPCEETAELLNTLRDKGKIKAIGTSNFSAELMERFRKEAPLATNQPPYNLFERGIEEEVLPYCKVHGIATLAYGAICRGLLSGKITEDTVFEGDDIRRMDPKFKAKNRKNYLNAVAELDNYAKEKYGKTVLELSIRWILDMNIELALWGARKPAQLDSLEGIFGWNINKEDKAKIDEILNKYIPESIGAEFMAPGE